MANRVESTIIIPVYGQWSFTAQCLGALRDTLEGIPAEVIVIDNNSADETGQLCEPLGKKLFGDNFRYHRCERNSNFGPASNLGAKMARGEYLVFLNNDTVPLPGWYPPLIKDFSSYSDIAATGPLLVYPESEPFGHTVQHLGVFVTPTFKVGHLYEGIPANSILAQKRRFFQIITAACMVIPRKLFLDTGLFDENYINGFEDVDLCARLRSKGYRMTVNPGSRVVHHTSRTPGRHSHEAQNSSYFREHTVSLLAPDWHIHLANDGLHLKVGAWQTLQGSMEDKTVENLRLLIAKAGFEELVQLLRRYPLWEEGYRAVFRMMKGPWAEVKALALAISRLWPEPGFLLDIYIEAREQGDMPSANALRRIVYDFCRPYEEYTASIPYAVQWAKNIHLDSLAGQYNAWLEKAESFRHELYLPFLERLWDVSQDASFGPHATWAYTLWRELVDLPGRTTKKTGQLFAGDQAIAFSVLMPVYNPNSEHLIAALNSLRSQDYPYWELCIADDASSDPAVRPLLEEWSKKEARIQVVFREENGHIARATNTALDMASRPYAVLMDQDDLLTPDALRIVAEAIEQRPDGLLFFSDEDKIFDDGAIDYPHFKNGKWDWELLCGQNFVNHLGVYRVDRLRAIGGFRDGFNGAQDYDMLLRYVFGADSERFIHIPKVLYHWRAHSGSTALDINAKSVVLESSQKALQEYLDLACPGAKALRSEQTQFLFARYPLPEKPPLASVIIDATNNVALAEAQAQYLINRTRYAQYELIVLYDQAASPGAISRLESFARGKERVRLFACPPESGNAEKWQLGAEKSRGEIFGFLGTGAVPLAENWLETIVAALSRSGVGAVGGRVFMQDKRLAHGGYLVDGNRMLACVFHGLPRTDPGYFAWGQLTRTVDALDGFCLFSHTDLYEKLGGFDPAMSDAALHDYCLRLNEAKYRTVWQASVDIALIADMEFPWLQNGYVSERNFTSRWQGKLEPVNINLVAAVVEWHLNRGLRPGQ